MRKKILMGFIMIMIVYDNIIGFIKIMAVYDNLYLPEWMLNVKYIQLTDSFYLSKP